MSNLKVVVLALALVAGLAWGRDPAQVREFRKTHPCPATGQTSGACPGWVVDHMIPLCAGGPDTPDNMQWQDKPTSLRKDKYERQLCANIKKYCPKPD